MYVLTSAGVGSLANIPWSSITYNHYRGQKLGLEVDYLFKSDMTGAYLSFKVFYFDELRDKYEEYFDIYLNNLSSSIRDFLRKEKLLTNDFIYDVDLVHDGKYSKIFSTGTIVAKYYSSNNIPSDEELLQDLNQFLDFYSIVEKNFNKIISVEYLEKTVKVGNMTGNSSSNNSFHEYLIEKGYLFDKEIIENYLLSLKVKPFAILTGNSGTGKTKLSQLFSQYISNIDEKSNLEGIDFKEKFVSSDLEDIDKSSEREYVTVKAKTNYSSWANTGWTLNRDDFKNIIPITECEGKFDLVIDGIPAKGSIGLLVQLYYDKNNQDLIDFFNKRYDENPNQVVDLKINKGSIIEFCSDEYIETNGSITLKQNSNQSAYDKRQWFMSKEFFNYIPFKNGYTNCEILVEDIKSSARIRITPKLTFAKNLVLQKYLRENEGKEVNVEIKIDKFNFDDFKPIWASNDKEPQDTLLDHDSISESRSNEGKIDDDLKNVYENYKIIPVGANWTENRNIVGYYNVITDQYQSTPAYDLIKQADESQEPHFLILDEMNLSHVERYFADFLSAIESGENIPLYGEEELTIPSNLFIIGTVNVDETTYMFSPKVLDRANVIEFKTYSAENYMLGETNIKSPEGNIEYLENTLSDMDTRDLDINSLYEIFKDVKVGDVQFWEILSDEIFKFQKILKKSKFDFGFRVINEIVRFMVVAWKYEGQPANWTNWERYFDAQIKQKMLPKLHGSQKIIGETLDDLFKECLINPSNPLLIDENIKYPSSIEKLNEMRNILNKQRYVSFIN